MNYTNNMKTQNRLERLEKIKKSAKEFYYLNYPEMTIKEAAFWYDYLNSEFHHKKT